MTLRHFALVLAFLARANAAVDAVTPAEKAVLQAIQSGRPADVSKLPDRTVHLAFLQQAARKSSNTVEIVGAVIPDNPDHLDIPARVELRDCRFPNGLQLDEAKLVCLTLKNCELADSTLTSPHIAEGLFITEGNLHKLEIQYGEFGQRLDISTESRPIVYLNNFSVPQVFFSRPSGILITGGSFTSIEMDARRPPHGTAQLYSIGFVGVTAKTIALRDVVTESLTFYQSSVDGVVELTNVSANKMDFSFSSVNALSWIRTTAGWPKSLILDGAQIKVMHLASTALAPPTDNQRLHRNVLDFLSAATYSAPVFTAYQQSLEDRGMSAEANETAFTMHEKWRRTQYDCAKISLRRCIWNSAVRTPLVAFDLIQQYGFGLGRSVAAPLLWSALFVIFGIFVFRRQANMEPRTDKAPAPYSSAWYSFELFLPVVDLGVAKDWRPAAKPRWRSTYARIHQLAGWILIPVAIAALTGGLKK